MTIAGGAPSPARTKPPEMALRTYRVLRLGAIGVIAILAVSLIKEYNRAGDCLQGSISAYYYTSVQSVFVGALVALGLVMIVLWGKSPFEDGFLNLAGMLAPVVAFVPTGKPNKCGLTDAVGEKVTTEAEKAAVIRASHDAVTNNMFAYLLVIGVVLVALLVLGILAIAVPSFQWQEVTDHPLSFWIPWAGASALWLFAADKFWVQDREDWFYGNAHKWSAIVLFGFIVAAIIDIGFQKWPWRGYAYLAETPNRRWAWTYWVLAAVMAAGAAAIWRFGKKVSFQDFAGHQTFWLEAWMIFWLAIFWVLQTWDRWSDGAPPRTAEERMAGLSPTIVPPARSGSATSGWTPDELDRTDAVDEIDIAALRPSRIIWLVRVGDDLYVRSVRGRDSAWFQSVLQRPEGCIGSGGVAYDVAFEEPAEADHDAIDEAYRRKYGSADPVDVDAIVAPTARVATLRLLRR